MPYILRVTWLRHAPFPEHFYHACSAFQRRSYVPNLKSLAQAVLKICLIVCQKLRGHVSFGESYLCIQSAFHMWISYWRNLKSAAQIIFKIFGIVCHKFYRSRDLGHAPFGENYWRARSAFPRGSWCVPNSKTLAEVILKICSTVCQKV